MIDPRDIVSCGVRVGDMSRDRLISFIGELNMTIAKLARERRQTDDVCGKPTLTVIVNKPLAVDQQPTITPDNFEQVLSDVLDEMNADAAAIAASTKEDDAF